jgi:hypothetical protein
MDAPKIRLFLLRSVAVVAVASIATEALSPAIAISLGRPWDDRTSEAVVAIFAITSVAAVAYISCKK